MNICYHLRPIYRHVIFILLRLYVRIISPWIKARFFAAWQEYQRGPVYRERLTILGFFAAYDMFSRWEQRYCLKLRRQKEPRLNWKIFFSPFSFTIPEDLQIAAYQGYFDQDAG